ncbi:7SK snRNA methylphosphate capping enzyme isoform X2 [Periophthalmus magnuspinnatus]|uniref:7SK snRNA methylphosphate capping enzyme isoform X2 n=1 Tax=Periophthalmus magnuspinnatus TaxID=409849 RepID=UPI00243667B6|nr:7SK snRNA methylphosphate capping enzyme isoform X2 [Periophthalmus magnuspinnatus]
MMSLDKPSALVQSEPSLPKPRPVSSQPMGKRRCSLGGFRAPPKRRRRANSESQSESVLPSHFLLGGNIFDPLNLNSLLNDEVNRLTNQETPQSSPLPQRGGDTVEIVVPRDITDPLNLKGAQQRRRRHRHRHGHSTSESTASTTAGTTASTTENTAAGTTNTAADSSPLWCELNTALTCRDDLAPPPQRRHTHPPLSGNRRRRTTSSCVTTATSKAQPIRFETPQVGGAKADSASLRPSGRRLRPKDRSRYQFGNCSKFYGFCGCYGDGDGVVGGADARLGLLEDGWFRGRRALDVGCGPGHVTLFIARSFSPAHILGVELDPRLVHAANQNVRHFLSHDLVKEERARRRGKETRREEMRREETRRQGKGTRSEELNQDPGLDRGLDQDRGLDLDRGLDQDLSELQRILSSLSFPQSFRVTRGPLCAPLLPMIQTEDRTEDPAPLDFPHNVTFLQGDYVCSGEAWPGRGLYDVILCLGVAKWIQLQGGDEGLARLFTRAYQSLSPGGLFLLETQPWTSYCHSKRASETTLRNFKTLGLRPEKFTSFLTATIGFSSYRLLTRPGNPRPIYLFHKGPAPRK